MAFEQEEEDFEFESVFRNDDDEDDGYVESSAFREYTDEEFEDNWGNFSFEELVFELENILGRSKKYFLSKKKRVIDAELMDNLAKLIVSKVPGEIIEGKNIIQQQQEIISDAKRTAEELKRNADNYYARTLRDADTKAADLIAQAKSKADSMVANADAQAKEIIARANAQAQEMVSDHVITQQAREKGLEIVEAAKQERRNIIDETNTNCQEYINRVVNWANSNIEGVNEYVYSLLGSAREAYASGISNIDSVKAKYANDYQSQKAALKTAPRITRKQQ